MSTEELSKPATYIPNYVRNIDINTNPSILLSDSIFDSFYIGSKKLCRTGSFEGHVQDDIVPWLRCPSIQGQTIHPFSKLSQMIVDQIETDFNEKPNIVKIQYYKDAKSKIEPHTDKILDLLPGSSIFNISFGSTRSFVLDPKPKVSILEKEVYKLEHNSLIILSALKNSYFLHGIPEELSHCDGRYSMIFRTSHTFKSKTTGLLSGPVLIKTMYDPPTKEEERELVKLWSVENKEPVSYDFYDTYNKTGLSGLV